MTTFPLYDTLFNQLSENASALERTEKQKLLKSIEKLDQDGHHKLYALILFHTQKTPQLPISSTGIELDLNDFDCKLQLIMYKFCELHLARMKELNIQKKEQDKQKKKNKINEAQNNIT